MDKNQHQVNLIELDCPLYEQLLLEEALLRTSNENFCLLNRGNEPTLVMGISGDAKALFHECNLKKIRRYTGGGAVLVDPGTLLASFIGEHDLLQGEPSPASIHDFAFSIWKDAFSPNLLTLRENDYCLEDRKVGGNAQSITKNRFVHHSTFLWDYSKEKINLLKMPEKRPRYRADRSHIDFLDKLKNHFPFPEKLFNQLKQVLNTRFSLQHKKSSDYLYLQTKEFRKSTQFIP